MIKRNVIVIACTEENMQGIIRGIEALDAEAHSIGIIHGAASDAVDEVTVIIAELAEATIVIEDGIAKAAHPQGKMITYFPVILPESVCNDRDKIIDYITDSYSSLIEELTKDL